MAERLRPYHVAKPRTQIPTIYIARYIIFKKSISEKKRIGDAHYWVLIKYGCEISGPSGGWARKVIKSIPSDGWEPKVTKSMMEMMDLGYIWAVGRMDPKRDKTNYGND